MKLFFSLLALILFTTPISASTSDSIFLIQYNDMLIPFLSTLAIYLFCTVTYVYVIFTAENLNRKRSLLIATFVWLAILLSLITYFDNENAIVITVLLCILTYIFIAIRSLKKVR